MARPSSRAALIAALGALVLAAGCGGSDDGGSGEVPGGADPESVAVIEGWAQTLASGDPEGAADFFALPSVAQNGTPPLRLRTREQAAEFNRALPCGAELVRAEESDEYVIATFELIERPGPGVCGSGVGLRARTAFLIEDGLIAEWVRAPNPDPPAPSGPVI